MKAGSNIFRHNIILNFFRYRVLILMAIPNSKN